ncbi:MAG: glycerophosphodiester phosphodiesterase [Gammaproteobacteria bacterium]|nr:glycerophosphodiester phosphodiesterase [Gammaproteobacteria bacterium]
MQPPAPVPALIAHRGYPARFPENSLEGIRAALEAGACFVEFDVQMSGDGVPVVIHDDNTRRTGAVGVSVLDTPLGALRRVCIGEPARFRQAFSRARIPTLEEIIAVLPGWPRAMAFVEIKRASLRRLGIQSLVPVVMEILSPALDQCIVVSFNSEAAHAARAAGAKRIGWAFEEWSDGQRDVAARLAPDYLFCEIGRLPPPTGPLWPGPWNWATYQTDDPEAALELAARGVALVETDNIGEMLRHPVLKQKACGND